MEISQTVYVTAYFNVLLVLVLSTLVCYVKGGPSTRAFNKAMLWPTAAFVVAAMWLRPHDPGDMAQYEGKFLAYQAGLAAAVPLTGDVLFNYFTFLCSRHMDTRTWWLVVSVIYNGAVIAAFRIAHDDGDAYPAFLFAATSVFYWLYGTNTVRAGLATSLIILGMACRRRRWAMVALFGLAVGTHRSALLPAAVFLTTFYFSKPAVYLLAYACAIPVSLAAGDRLQREIGYSSLFSDERLASYLTKAADPRVFRSVGFRWDFVSYSLLPIALGAYYIYRRRFRDPFYQQLFSTYIACNAFWLLMIRASNSDRFAYLSWFLMSWIIVYPLLKQRMFRRHWAMTGALVAVYFAFTYYVNLSLRLRE